MVESMSMPFGEHAGRPLTEVPGDYLRWLAGNVKLSTGLRPAVSAELTRRGVQAPPPPPRPERRCPNCPSAETRYTWLQDRSGRRRVRAECGRCRQWLGFAPTEPPYTTAADAAASPTPVLDVLLLREEFGVELRSDGEKVDIAPGDWTRTPQRLRDLVRQSANTLGRMLGPTGEN